MSELEVSEVRSRRDRDAFIKFQWRIYKNDPAWVPPLIIERKAFLDRKRHPFYRHGDAALFLARQNGEIVGRIMASDDPNYNSLHQSNIGCFGLFECIDDCNIAAALFEAAAGWQRKKGRDEIMGPIDYSTNYVCGLLIDGFEHSPTILTAHNPPYYARLIEHCGFTKEKDWYAWWFKDIPAPMERLRKIATARSRKHDVAIRSIDLKLLTEESRRLRAVFNQAWRNNWGFVPMTDDRGGGRTHGERNEAAGRSEDDFDCRNRPQTGGFRHLRSRYQFCAGQDQRTPVAIRITETALLPEEDQDG
ncbi:MAG: hypothetical protein DME81_09245, partial [Verrucomicrobia bacterium]